MFVLGEEQGTGDNFNRRVDFYVQLVHFTLCLFITLYILTPI